LPYVNNRIERTTVQSVSSLHIFFFLIDRKSRQQSEEKKKKEVER